MPAVPPKRSACWSGASAHRADHDDPGRTRTGQRRRFPNWRKASVRPPPQGPHRNPSSDIGFSATQLPFPVEQLIRTVLWMCQDRRVVDLVAEAATCNAGWCDAVCRSLSLPTRWSDEAWTVAERSPDGYPDAVTLSPKAEAHNVLQRVDGGVGCSVKDSFAVLDLEPWGFRVLFKATWIRRTAARAIGPVTLDWREVRSAAELDQWSSGHDLDIFGPALLDIGDLRFFHSGPGSGAGFALNRVGRVVGVSNIFVGQEDPIVVWSDLVAVAARTNPGMDLAGYELGEDLRSAAAVGFIQTGPLQVWML